MPDAFIMLKESLGLLLTLTTLIGALGSGLGYFVGKWRKERSAIEHLIKRMDNLGEQLRCMGDQNNTRAILAQANLRLSFALAEELVRQGANGELKRAVGDLRDLVITSSIPPMGSPGSITPGT